MKFIVSILALIIVIFVVSIGFNVHKDAGKNPVPKKTKKTIVMDGSIYFGNMSSNVYVDSVDGFTGDVKSDFEALPKDVQDLLKNGDHHIIQEYNTNKTFRQNLARAAQDSFYPLTENQIIQLQGAGDPNYSPKEWEKHVVSEGVNY